MNPGDRVLVRNQPVTTDPPTAAECLAHCRSRMAPDDYDMAVLLIEVYAMLQRGLQIEQDHQAWQASIDRFAGALAKCSSSANKCRRSGREEHMSHPITEQIVAMRRLRRLRRRTDALLFVFVVAAGVSAILAPQLS